MIIFKSENLFVSLECSTMPFQLVMLLVKYNLDASPATLIVNLMQVLQTVQTVQSTFFWMPCAMLCSTNLFRKITKSQLVNAVNEKELLVELEFSIGSREYMVRTRSNPMCLKSISMVKRLRKGIYLRTAKISGAKYSGVEL